MQQNRQGPCEKEFLRGSLFCCGTTDHHVGFTYRELPRGTWVGALLLTSMMGRMVHMMVLTTALVLVWIVVIVSTHDRTFTSCIHLSIFDCKCSALAGLSSYFRRTKFTVHPKVSRFPKVLRNRQNLAITDKSSKLCSSLQCFFLGGGNAQDYLLSLSRTFLRQFVQVIFSFPVAVTRGSASCGLLQTGNMHLVSVF